MRHELVHNVQRAVSDRFGVPAPTVTSQFGQGPAVVLSRLTCNAFGHGSSKPAEPEDAYVLHVMLRDTQSYDLKFKGERVVRSPVARDGVIIGSLRSQPVAVLDSPFDLVRIYVTQAALDDHEAAAERGGRITLSTAQQGARDALLAGVIRAILPVFEQTQHAGQLFVDSISLAIRDHLIRAYADQAVDTVDASGGLSPWLEKRAKEFIDSRLKEGASLEEVARHCNLSASHFSKAFRATTGRPPHRWLLERRVERAKSLLSKEDWTLGSIAIECGFSDASHFSRIFSQLTREPPAAWRRRNRP